MTDFRNKKYKYLLFGLLFDFIGSMSFFIPGIGEFADVIWAPLAFWLMTRMYRGNMGKTAGMITFVEELMPGLDVIPTFTIMWVYTFVLKRGEAGKIVKSGANT